MSETLDAERWHFSTDSVPIESSMIRSMRYEPSERLLEIVFQNRSVYQFVSVPPELYEHLLHAQSKGRYFLAHIRGMFPYWRLHRVRRRRVQS